MSNLQDYINSIAATASEDPNVQKKVVLTQRGTPTLAEAAAAAWQQSNPTTADKIMEAALAAQAQDSGVGYVAKPLAQLADAWGGSKMSYSMSEPESPVEQAAKLIQALPNQKQFNPYDALMDEKRLELMDKKLNAPSNQRATQDRYDDRKATTVEKDIVNLGQKVIKESSADAQKFSQMDEAFARGDYQSVFSTLGLYSRTVAGEKGVLTDTDIQRVIPRTFQGDVAKFMSYLSNTPSSQLPPEFTKNLRELAALAKQRTRERYSSMINSDRKARMKMPEMGAIVRDPGIQAAYDSYDQELKTAFPDAPVKKSAREEILEVLKARKK